VCGSPAAAQAALHAIQAVLPPVGGSGLGSGADALQPPPASHQIHAEAPKAAPESSSSWISVPALIVALLLLGAIALLFVAVSSLSDETRVLSERMTNTLTIDQTTFLVEKARRETAADLVGVVARAAERQPGPALLALRDELRAYAEQAIEQTGEPDERAAAGLLREAERAGRAVPGAPGPLTAESFREFAWTQDELSLARELAQAKVDMESSHV
jgi:hypothetical protein